MAGTNMSGRRPKWAMMALRNLQEEKVEAAEQSFAILVELAHMERLPKDWQARKELNESVMNRIWGLPKTKSELTGRDGEPLINPNTISIVVHDDTP